LRISIFLDRIDSYALAVYICLPKDGGLLKWLRERQTRFMENTMFQQLSVSKESQVCFRFNHYYCLEADEFSLIIF